MTPYEFLQSATESDRQHILTAPVVTAIPEGRFNLEAYRYFLVQAFHHVRHTVPLMMACGARLPPEKEWVREALVSYIEEEYGHHEWILNDLVACGVSREDMKPSEPGLAITLMVSYLYDAINRGNPLALFGMVHVLEGTSITLATQLGKIVQQQLNLPNKAFSYLYSHGELDIEHYKFFQNLINKLSDPADQQAILQASKICYRLYGDMLREIPLPIAGGLHAAA